jgi:hypothetical protein
MFVISCTQIFTTLTISDWGNISQAITAVFNLFLAYYIFVYQKNNNTRIELSTSKLNEQNIRRQLFKEFILEPNIHFLNNFFKNLEKLKSNINSDNLTEEEILCLNRYVKDEATNFRVNFNDAIIDIDKELYNKIKHEVDDLIGKLTISFSDNEHKLTNVKTYERIVLLPIRNSRHNVISSLFNYRG